MVQDAPVPLLSNFGRVELTTLLACIVGELRD
jgi:hypothetical protein